MSVELDFHQGLSEAILDARQKIQKRASTRKSFYLMASVFGMFLFIHYFKTYEFPAWLVVVFWFFMMFFLLAAFGTDVEKEKAVYEKLVLRKELLFGATEGRNGTDSHFDALVNINIENLAEYYRLVKIHTNKSFLASLSVAFIGFFLIVAGLTCGYLLKEQEVLSYVATGSGVIMEFVSASFFYLYSKTVRQLKGYHDSLIDVQNMLLSFRLIESTSDVQSKVKLVEKMMDYLSSKRQAPLI